MRPELQQACHGDGLVPRAGRYAEDGMLRSSGHKKSLKLLTASIRIQGLLVGMQLTIIKQLKKNKNSENWHASLVFTQIGLVVVACKIPISLKSRRTSKVSCRMAIS